MICLLLCPILVDLSNYFPAIAPVQACIPVTMFLRSCTGSTLHTLLLSAIAAASLLLCLLLDILSRPRLRAAGYHANN